MYISSDDQNTIIQSVHVHQLAEYMESWNDCRIKVIDLTSIGFVVFTHYEDVMQVLLNERSDIDGILECNQNS